jgi:hypothetical protein
MVLLCVVPAWAVPGSVRDGARVAATRASSSAVCTAFCYRGINGENLNGRSCSCTRLSRCPAQPDICTAAAGSSRASATHDHPPAVRLKETTMIKRTFGMAALVMVCAGAAAVLPAGGAQAAGASVKCDLAYNLSGWSLIYKHAEGSGMITCDNGQSANVKIAVVGGGLTAGKYHIDNGKGEISKVHDIADVYGDYVQAGAEAGVVKSSSAQVLTKGTTSLALTGTGQGVNLGISVGKFTISKP